MPNYFKEFSKLIYVSYLDTHEIHSGLYNFRIQKKQHKYLEFNDQSKTTQIYT